ncbi:MAG: CocE/NonD family hydrolase [Pseudomonadota bacterium]|nr:CocE/NonD family hydrolase [Pseudomonadota bacterium]
MDPFAKFGARARRSLEWRRHLLTRRIREIGAGPRLARTDLRLLSAAGYPLAARLTRPQGDDRLPGVVISPAIHQGLREVDTYASAVTAAEVARLGYAVLSFDPAGRGESWGEEDFGGPEHQDDLRVAILALLATPGVTGVGVLSLSYGIVAAAGALSRYADELPVRWLLDWEGPCDREIITTGGTRLVPAAGHALDDEDYWRPREPVRHIGGVRCGYARLQAWPDHAQPDELRHAERMIRAGAAGSVPWVQINDHPRGVLPPRPIWLAGGPLAANEAILRKLGDLRG